MEVPAESLAGKAFHGARVFSGMLTMFFGVAVICDLLVRLPLLPINVERRPRPALSGKWCLLLNDTLSFAHLAFI